MSPRGHSDGRTESLWGLNFWSKAKRRRRGNRQGRLEFRSTYSCFILLHPWSSWETKKEIRFSRPLWTCLGHIVKCTCLPGVFPTWKRISLSPTAWRGQRGGKCHHWQRLIVTIKMGVNCEQWIQGLPSQWDSMWHFRNFPLIYKILNHSLQSAFKIFQEGRVFCFALF